MSETVLLGFTTIVPD